MSLVADSLAKDLQETRRQFIVSARACHNLIVARDATRLVVTDTAQNEIDLVVEIIVQHAMREDRVLGDLTQTGSGVTEFGKRLQRGLGKFRPPLSELVHGWSVCPVKFLVCYRGHLLHHRTVETRCRDSIEAGDIKSFGENAFPTAIDATGTLRQKELKPWSIGDLTLVSNILDRCNVPASHPSLTDAPAGSEKRRPPRSTLCRDWPAAIFPNSPQKTRLALASSTAWVSAQPVNAPAVSSRSEGRKSPMMFWPLTLSTVRLIGSLLSGTSAPALVSALACSG